MTAHAAGVRMPYAAAPAVVRGWAERELGSPVARVVDCVGGMSPGPAARLASTTGRRAFLKAVGPELNPDTPDLLRLEADALVALPRHMGVPRLYSVYDDGAWVALLIEDVDGTLPALPWRLHDLSRVAAAVSEVGELLTPCPWAAAPDAVTRSTPFLSRWRELVDDPPDDLEPFWRDNLETLGAYAGRALEAVAGDALVHWDVRADNLLVSDDRVVLVDWGQARRGAAWVDLALLAIDLATHGGDTTPAAFLEGNRALSSVDPEGVTSVLCAVAMAWQVNSRRPPKPGLPTLPSWMRRWSDALVPTLATRL